MPDTAATHLMIGLLLSAGLLLGLIATRLGIPRVTAYVFAGVIFSPKLLGGPLGFEVGSATEVLTGTALGVIAYLIGGSVTTGQLRRTGRVILLALVGETLGAGVAVWLAVRAVVPEEINGVSPDSLALILAAAAATTAPAATLAVLHQYRARGPLSETLLGVVALDDATGIMLFALAVVVTTGSTILTGLAQAGFEIVGSIGLGIGAGYLLSRLSRHLHDRSLWLPAIMAALLVTIGVAGFAGLSPLLAAIALGFSARFILAGAGDHLFVPIEQLEEFVFLIFFTVAGAHFDFELLSQNVALVGAYFFARVVGKLVGAAGGARVAGAPPQVSRWLGLALMPQAGVAVGLVLTLAQYPFLAPVGPVVVNVILGTTMLYELVGPFAVLFALGRAGELGEKRERVRA